MAPNVVYSTNLANSYLSETKIYRGEQQAPKGIAILRDGYNILGKNNIVQRVTVGSTPIRPAALRAEDV